MQNRDEMSKNFAVVFKVIFNFFLIICKNYQLGKKKASRMSITKQNEN